MNLILWILWSLGAIQGWRILAACAVDDMIDLEGIDWFMVIVFGGLVAFCVWPVIVIARWIYVIWVKYELEDKNFGDRFAKTVLVDLTVETREEKRNRKTREAKNEIRELRAKLAEHQSQIHHADR